ncbi:MAG TPA: aminodeoxychorismate/anthranilate synthase component II [Phycisphaerales bacterium]|nr:aminodeoxychorismate/anthranilate synthase component II [Phycisphaerales bacterium]
MLLLLDNYDSFTFNLVHRLGALDPSLPIRVVRNDQLTLADAIALNPRFLVISPGPCTPKHTGICPDLVSYFRGRIPILGVCLGHQLIADIHNITVHRHSRLMHGKTSLIHHDNLGIFAGLPNPFTAARYHSLIIDPATLTPDFTISAWTSDHEPMAIRWTPRTFPLGRGVGVRAGTPVDAPISGHSECPNPLQHVSSYSSLSEFSERLAPMDGVQFHPESFLTQLGPQLLKNFLNSSPIAGPLRGPGAESQNYHSNIVTYCK